MKIAIEEHKNLYTYLLLLVFASIGIVNGNGIATTHSDIRL